ncbi:MAG: ABC transporter substrate-binding protein [Promethearchaeota archaeon]
MGKKDIIISILTTFLIVSGVGNVYFALNRPFSFSYGEPTELKYASRYIARDVDPQWAWDSASFEFAAQIWEGLFAIDLSDPQFSLVPRLATSLGSYSSDGKELTIPLKRGVKFHDGTLFNAEAVKFSFDRLAYLMNVFGTLPPTCYYNIPTIMHSLYEWSDGTPIINHTEMIDSYTIKFVLNKPFGPFRHLLAFPGSCILSPLSTPSDDYIIPSTAGPDNCVGTGPFILEEFGPFDIRFHAYDGYHLGKSKIDNLVFIKIFDHEARNIAVLSGAVDIIIGGLYSYYDDFEENDNIVLFDDLPSWWFEFIKILNQDINSTWRKAISFAINYSCIINLLTNNHSFRLNGILAPCIFGYDPTIKPINYNLTYAREVMVNMGFGNEFWTDIQWRASEFASWNFTYISRSDAEQKIYEVLRDNLDLIGINLTEGEKTYYEWIRDKIWSPPPPSIDWWYSRQNFLFLGWVPDYPDAYNSFLPYFSTTASSTWFPQHLNPITDPWIEQKLEQASQEFNDTARAAIYSEIQRYNNEELFPLIYLYHNPVTYIHNIHLKNVPYNPTGVFYAYPIEFEE